MKKIAISCFPLFLLFLVWGIFFYRTFLFGLLPVPTDTLVGLYHPWRDQYATQYPRGVPFKNFLITDPIRQQIPWKKIVMDQWKTGKVPLWNPYAFSGTSLVGNIQAGSYYPFNILFLLFSFPLAWTLLIILQPLLASLFCYLYLRNKNLQPFSSLIGSISWAYGGFTIAWMTWGTIVHVSLWLPLALLSIDHILSENKRNRLLWVIVLTISWIMMMTAGHAQIAFYCIICTLLYFLMQIKRNNRVAIIFTLIAGLATAIFTSVQWVPLTRALQQSSRFAQLSEYKQIGWFLPWQHLIQFFVPDFFGNPATLNYWGVWNYGEFIGYSGIISIVFLFVSYSLRKRKIVQFYIFLLFGSLLCMVSNPISQLPFVLHVPLLATMQPTRLMILVCFSISILSAFGFDYVLREKTFSLKKVSLLLSAIFIILWPIIIFRGHLFTKTIQDHLLVSKQNLLWPSLIVGIVLLLLIGITRKTKNIRQICFALLILVLCIDLIRFGWKFTPFTAQTYFFPNNETLTFLNNQNKPFRIMNTDDRLLPSNVSAYYGLEAIEGYDPIYSSDYEEFLAAMNRNQPNIAPPYGFHRIITTTQFDSPLLPLLNVRYILSLKDLSSEYLHKVFQEGETRVYEYSRVAPRAYFVDQVDSANTKQEVLNDLFNPKFDPLHTAVVNGLFTEHISAVGLGDTIDIDKYNSNKLDIKTQSNGPKFMVISQRFDDRSRVSIDGNQTFIYKTNYLFMGFIVPAGKHTIIVSYQ